MEELAVTCRSLASQPSSRQVAHGLWREPGLALTPKPTGAEEKVGDPSARSTTAGMTLGLEAAWI